MESTPPERTGPGTPTDVKPRGWWAILKRTVSEFREDNLTDWAAALTYYGVLAVFPALIALVSVLGLVGESATQPLIDNLTALTPSTAGDVVESAIENITANQGAAGLALLIGIAGALWSASGYVGGFTRASNAIYEIDEGRPFLKLKPIQIAITAVMILLLALCGIAVLVTGPVAEQVGKLFGVEGAALTVWDIAKWPVIAIVVVTMFAVMYWAAPNVQQPGFRWITPGGVLAVVLWLIASAAFAFFVANFGSYNATYGALAGVVVFLVWLWITNIAILLGAELNAELERQRELESGVPQERTIALEHRDPP